MMSRRILQTQMKLRAYSIFDWIFGVNTFQWDNGMLIGKTNVAIVTLDGLSEAWPVLLS